MGKISKKVLLLIMTGAVIAAFAGCTAKKESDQNENNKIIAAVSIVPQETFVKAVGGDKVDVVTLIPTGKSPENYAPTQDVMKGLSDASIYFTIGVPTEEASILPKIEDFNKNIKIVSMTDAVSKVYSERKFESGERDPHIWLSPKRVKVMIQEIAKELSLKDPDNKSFYESNAEAYINKLDKLDSHIKESLSSLDKKVFICYHPAFGYFADDYGLKMIALEKEGKEATIEDLQSTIDYAKNEGIKVIFYQAEIDSKQSETFASEIGGKTEMIEPLSADYINNMEKIAETFKKTMEVN